MLKNLQFCHGRGLLSRTLGRNKVFILNFLDVCILRLDRLERRNYIYIVLLKVGFPSVKKFIRQSSLLVKVTILFQSKIPEEYKILKNNDKKDVI